MPSEKSHYDVAVSFCHEDLDVALGIREALGDSFRTFVYAARQDEVAGTNGLESFRDIFRNRCTLAVVLYRARWGRTPWTRVELEAITDRFLNDGPAFLFFVNMDDSVPPAWVPEKLIRFSFSLFGLEQAVGAIKARALELGAVPTAVSPAQRAQRAQETIEFGMHRDLLFRTVDGVALAAAEAQRLVGLVASGLREARDAAPTLQLVVGASTQVAGVRIPGVTLFVSYYNPISNVLDSAKLFIRELRGGALVPGEEGRFYIHEQPTEIELIEFTPELILGHGWCWRASDGKTLSSEALADLAIARFFSLVDRLAAGDFSDRHES